MAQKIEPVRFQQQNPHDILVTGSSGFIGSRLVEKLSRSGYSVTAMSRKKIDDTKLVKYIQADALDLASLKNAFAGKRVAFYLLHSMEGDKKHWKEFAEREKIQAQNFLLAASEAGVERIIYLGGLVNDSLELSPHMRSRKEVGDILFSKNIPVTQLRASLIIGAGGGSYAMLRYLVERLRVMICPKWVKTMAQPIAVDDVIEYLVRCLETPETVGKTFDIGGPEKITYEQLMRQYAAYLNKNLFVIQIPFLTTRLSSYWVDLITPVKASLARPLIDSLVHDTTVKDDSITKIIPFPLKSVREAIDIATKEMKEESREIKSTGKTRFEINQKILLGSLLSLAVIGTTYYWLDNRPDVYQLPWLIASALWFLAIGFSILFVHYKTRLGYLLGGLLSWTTLAFWLMDIFPIVFEKTLIANEPSLAMTIRDLVGVVIASLAVASSHNVFHKIQNVQHGGRPV
ncbi:MAG TPA: NAD(P)H-binding protein [Nitrosopumilaceae archaeon]|nr:NAD(P)H-binding protein [Nitrosopumilaceae archaeon]